MSIPWETLAGLLKESLRRFADEDCYLIAEDINERSITHRLGCYLEQAIIVHVAKINAIKPDSLPPYKVDCEYNGFRRKERKWVPWDYWIDGEEELYYNPFPDIIAHVRRRKGPNLLVVEVKKEQRTDPLGRLIDKMKLVAYLLPPLRYEFGIFLSLDEEDNTLHVTEAKLVGQAAVKGADSQRIKTVWGALQPLVHQAIEEDGKVRLRRYVRR
jgi:hypothetical protein